MTDSVGKLKAAAPVQVSMGPPKAPAAPPAAVKIDQDDPLVKPEFL